MNRRGFLTRSGLALGALIVGDEVLEALDRLNHRKVWAGHTFAPPYSVTTYTRAADIPEGGYEVKYLRVRTTEPGYYFYVNRSLLNAPVWGLTRATP